MRDVKRDRELNPFAPLPTFGERLFLARRKRGLTIKELGERSGVPPSAISHIEHDRRMPSCKNLVCLAKALKVTSDYLLGLGYPMVPYDPKSSGKLTRYYKELTSEDQDLVDDFAEMLANRMDTEGRG